MSARSGNSSAATSPAATHALSIALGLGLVVHLALVLRGIHFDHAGLVESDGYFHTQLAYLLPERGLSREFRWTQLSLWRDHFCDKEFLFHLLLAPFTRLASDPLTGAKVCMALFVGVFFVGYHRILRSHRIPGALFFSFLLGSMGSEFVLRLTMIRAHVVSVALLLIGTHLAVSGRWRGLAILAFIYSWSYSFPFVLFATLAAFVIGQLAAGEPADWRAPLLAFAGSTAGLVLHPYSPGSIVSVLIHTDVLLQLQSDATNALARGDEILANDTWSFLVKEPLLTLSFPVLAVLGRGSRLSGPAMGLLFSAGFWLMATLHSVRFIEYSAPLMAMAWAFVARDLVGGRELTPLLMGSSARRAGTVALLVVVIAAHVRTLDRLEGELSRAPPVRFRGAKVWMEANLGEHETVLNLNWSDFPDLFYVAPRQNYVWGIEPGLSRWFDRNRTDTLNAILLGKQMLNFPVLRSLTGARYAIISTHERNRSFFEPWVAYRDDDSLILDMQREVAPPSGG